MELLFEINLEAHLHVNNLNIHKVIYSQCLKSLTAGILKHHSSVTGWSVYDHVVIYTSFILSN